MDKFENILRFISKVFHYGGKNTKILILKPKLFAVFSSLCQIKLKLRPFKFLPAFRYTSVWPVRLKF